MLNVGTPRSALLAGCTSRGRRVCGGKERVRISCSPPLGSRTDAAQASLRSERRAVGVRLGPALHEVTVK